MSRLFFLSFFILLAFPAMAVETLPGNACTAGENGQYRESGGPEITGGHFLVCDGSTWNTVVDYADNGRSLMQVINDTGTCTAIKTGRIRYDNVGDIWNYCDGSTWKPFSIAPPDVTSGLVSRWKMDETSGTTASDSVGSNNGTLVNGPVWMASGGKIGGALNFDGANDYVEKTSAASIGLTSFTLSAWVYIPTSIPTGWRNILEYSRWTSNWYGLWMNGSGKFHFRWQDDGSPSAYRKDFLTGPSPDTWYHVVGTVDAGTATAKMYVNGSLDATVTSIQVPIVQTSTLKIGNAQTVSEGWKGRIDDVRIYNRALSPSEVTTLYNFTGP